MTLRRLNEAETEYSYAGDALINAFREERPIDVKLSLAKAVLTSARERADAARKHYDGMIKESIDAVASATKTVDELSREFAKSIAVDRTAQMLTDGSPVPADRSHTAHTASGQQKGYIVLTEAERAKGFARPVRDAYRHEKCGSVTTMGRALSETYARDPHFYSGTFCCSCRAHFPVGEDGEFVWLENDGREIEKVGT